MPKRSKRQIHSLSAINQRWATGTSKSSSSEDDAYTMRMNDTHAMQISDDDSLTMTSSDEETNTSRSYFKNNLQTCDIGDIFELCKLQCNKKDLSVLLYMTLRHFSISYAQVDTFLKQIGGLSAEVAHKWATLFINETFDRYSEDGRGGKRGDAFYDVYPDIEVEAKTYAMVQCQQKAASFTILDLAQFINTKYCEVNGLDENEPDLVRSVASCRLDMRKWGGRFEANTKRPYFEGHERSDVVAHRDRFVTYLLNHKDDYYTVESGEDPGWIRPRTSARKILICKIYFYVSSIRYYSFISP